MKLIKRLIARFLIDDLLEPNLLIRFIGLTFIIFGILFLCDLIDIGSQFLMCISFAGAFFVTSDISQYYYDSFSEKSALPSKQRYTIKVICKVFKFTSLFLAIFSLVAGPYLILPITTSTLDKLSTTVTVIAIGLTIFNVSLNNTKKQLAFYKGIIDDFEKVAKELEKQTQEDN